MPPNGYGTEDQALPVISDSEPHEVELLIHLSVAPDDLGLALNTTTIAWR